MTMLYSVRMPRVLVYPLAAVALVALTVAGPALAGPSLDDVVRGVEAAYGRMIDLRADSNQTSVNKSLNSTIPAHGAVHLKKGGKQRSESRQPPDEERAAGGAEHG